MRRLSYANVTSTLALFLAFGGVGYAAFTIDGHTLRKRSLPGDRVIRNSLTGREVKETSLGAVPVAVRAKNARNAVRAFTAGKADRATRAMQSDTAGSASVAKNAQRLGGNLPSVYLDRCPANTQLYTGLCFDKTPRVPANSPNSPTSLLAATKICNDARPGGRVPTAGELLLLQQAFSPAIQIGGGGGNYEATSTYDYNTGSGTYAPIGSIDQVGHPLPYGQGQGPALRCVFIPTDG